MKNNKIAYTLAEILVTLGVIGVVAAVTLPVLSKMYKKMVVKNQIKQSYNLISNAVNLVALDDDYPHGCYYGTGGISTNASECRQFFDAVISKLGTTRICERYSFAKGCIPDYKDEDFPNSSGCTGFSAVNIKTATKSAILKNGTIIFSYGYYNMIPIIAFDINGFKGPNKPGHDVYAMRLSAKQQGFPVYGLSNNNRIVECLVTSDSTMLFKNLSEILK